MRSNVGSAPILLPQGIQFKLSPRLVDEVTALRMSVDKLRNGKPKVHITQEMEITGPKGTVTVGLADFVKVDVDESKAVVSVENPTAKHQRSMWGTTRTLINNGINGVSEGHLCIVKFVGTGFRAILEPAQKPEFEGQQQLSLRVGFCVPQIVPIPQGIDVQVPVPHRVVIEGCDKQKVKLLAAEIRKHRKPEPYKGKGIFVDDETIALKQKKIK